MPDLTIILWTSVFLQVAAVILALRLIPLTKKTMAWILLSLAFFLMASRRTLDLLFGEKFIDDVFIHSYSTKSVALVISLLLVSGLLLTRRIFEQQQRDADQLRKFSLAVEQSSSATVIFTTSGLIEYANQRFCDINNTKVENLYGQTPGFLTTNCTPQTTLNKIWNKIKIGGTWKSEFFNKDDNGNNHWSRAVISPIKNSKEAITFYIATFEDITIEKQQRQAIKKLSLLDSLTQLPNRKLFQENLQLAIDLAEKTNQTISVLLLDINNFKSINNTLGHLSGDIILQEISSRLVHIEEQEKSYYLARLGGDEFLFFAADISHDKTIQLANTLSETILKPYVIDNKSFELSVNVGYTLFPKHGTSADMLIKNADLAMNAAKTSNNSIIQYAVSLEEGKFKRLQLNSHIRHAAENNEFILYYQPQTNISTNEIIGAEALIRWIHPEFGLVPPDDFIEIAEQSGNIYLVTEWVISNSLQQLSEWHSNGLDFELSINISASDIQNPELVSLLETEMIRNRIEPAWLKLEITENSMMLYSNQTTSALTRISELGIAISIDDFGTGYSSLQYLTKMPVNNIKIDKSFVLQMLKNDQDAVIVRSTIDLAHNLGLKITAEGIENEETLNILQILGCDYAQGHFIAKPMNNTSFVNWLKKYDSQE